MTSKTDTAGGRSLDDLKRTIAGLLETEGRTEAEVKVFQRKAAKMMHELGLTEDEVRAKDPDMFQSETIITRFDWIVAQLTMNAIENLTGTQCWYQILPTPTGKRSDRKIIYFAGYRSDVDQATWLFNHVLSEAKAGARGISVTKERNSYLVGFASAVQAKVHALAASLAEVREEVTGSSGTDLVLLEKERVVLAFLEEIAPNLCPDQTKGTKVRNHAAAQAGVRDGKNVALGRGVSQGARALPSS